jgi:hypothetical protein
MDRRSLLAVLAAVAAAAVLAPATASADGKEDCKGRKFLSKPIRAEQNRVLLGVLELYWHSGRKETCVIVRRRYRKGTHVRIHMTFTTCFTGNPRQRCAGAPGIGLDRFSEYGDDYRRKSLPMTMRTPGKCIHASGHISTHLYSRPTRSGRAQTSRSGTGRYCRH